jgi:hypothetical protein
VLHAKFRFNGGTMDVNPISPFGGDSFPFLSDSGMRQWLYLASELGTSGKITGIACRDWNGGGASSAQTYTYKIVMSHLTATTLDATRSTNLPSPVTVFNGPIGMPAGLLAGDYFTIPLSRSFSYNGRDNLVIDISGTGTANSFGCVVSTDPAYAGRRGYSSGPDDTTMTVSQGLPVMRFSISK